MRHVPRSFTARVLSRAAIGLVLAAIMVGATGLGCDHEAQTAFRQAAVGPIGDGVRTAMNGILDGVIAAIEDAGDGGAT